MIVEMFKKSKFEPIYKLIYKCLAHKIHQDALMLEFSRIIQPP